MQDYKQKLFLLPIIAGIIMIIVGVSLRIPGGALTTLGPLNGEETELYEFDNIYSAIDEYVGGDAYNYIIGASLVAGKMAGTLAVKAICIVGGILTMCAGLLMIVVSNNIRSESSRSEKSASKEQLSSTQPEQSQGTGNIVSANVSANESDPV